jgi:hypothetical protein
VRLDGANLAGLPNGTTPSASNPSNPLMLGGAGSGEDYAVGRFYGAILLACPGATYTESATHCPTMPFEPELEEWLRDKCGLAFDAVPEL